MSLPSAPPLDPAQALRSAPGQITMDNMPEEGDDAMDVDGSDPWCHCPPMRRRSQVENAGATQSSGGVPLLGSGAAA